jgi:hypothetical protein
MNHEVGSRRDAVFPIEEENAIFLPILSIFGQSLLQKNAQRKFSIQTQNKKGSMNIFLGLSSFVGRQRFSRQGMFARITTDRL